MFRSSRLIAFISGSALLLASPAAFAQGEAAGAGLGISSLTSSILVPVTTTVGAVLLVVMLVNKNGSAQLQNYLQHNREAVQASLYMPDAGQEATTDLAAMFGISQENSSDFATLLFQERALLSGQLAQADISEEAAYRFGRHIVEKMQQHPTLSLDVQRQLDQAHAAR